MKDDSGKWVKIDLLVKIQEKSFWKMQELQAQVFGELLTKIS